MNESSMERTLKNVAKALGLFLLVISVYLSYDGFDQGVTGGNMKYSTLAKLIGVIIAVAICALQFIFSSRYEQLNTTLKGAGLVSYAYSIWTNYLGAKHILGMDDATALATAFFMDVVPEPMIAWSLGDAMKGDVLGNIGKWFTGYQPKPQQQPQQQPQQNQQHQQHQQSKKEEHREENRGEGKSEAFEQLRKAQGFHQMQDRRNGQQQGGKHKEHQNNRNERGR
jgi:hypothetical protein